MSASVLLAIFSFIARALGLITTPLLAAKFGASSELDAYFAAFRLPDLIFNLLVIGTVTVAFIPLITPLIEKKQLDRAYNFAAAVFNWLALGLSFILIILYFLTPSLIPIFTENFTPENIDLTINLTRLMLLSPLFFALSAVLGSICNANHRFLPYALAPVFYKLGIIVGIIFLSPRYGITGVAYGVVIGALAHLLTNLPTLAKLHWHWRPALFIETTKLKTIAKLSFPRLISIGATQINLFVDTFLATGIAIGSLTIFNFADSIGNLPVGIIGLSIAVAAYPTLSSFAHHKKTDELKNLISRRILTIIFLLLPITVVTIFLSPGIITALFDYGKFNPEHIPTAALTLAFFAISFVPQSFIPLLSRTFYSHHQIKWPVISAVFTLLTNIFLAFLFVKYLELPVWSLALAYSIAAFINAIILTISYSFTFGSLLNQSFLSQFLKIIFINTALFSALYFTQELAPNINIFIRLIIFGGLSSFLYFLLAEMLHLQKLWRR